MQKYVHDIYIIKMVQQEHFPKAAKAMKKSISLEMKMNVLQPSY